MGVIAWSCYGEGLHIAYPWAGLMSFPDPLIYLLLEDHWWV